MDKEEWLGAALFAVMLLLIGYFIYQALPVYQVEDAVVIGKQVTTPGLLSPTRWLIATERRTFSVRYHVYLRHNVGDRVTITTMSPRGALDSPYDVSIEEADRD